MTIDETLIPPVFAPLMVGLISWFIKEYIFSLMQKRQEALRAEWKSRLVECWSPLFFWSGAILTYSAIPNKKEEAVSELQTVLVKNANLIPLNHYHALVKLIEISAGATDEQYDIDEVKRTREYIYRQIELLNFVLFKKDTNFDPSVHVALFGSQQTLLRLASQIVQHLISWGVLALYIYAVYKALSIGHLGFSLLLLLPFAILVIHDVNRRYQLSKEAEQTR